MSLAKPARIPALGVQNSQMRLRGFDEYRYQVCMNGRTWKGAGVKGGFFVDWSTITTSDLERLEVIRGGLSAEYPNTLGGVITINTVQGSKEPKLYPDTCWGSWNTQNYRFLHGGDPTVYSRGFWLLEGLDDHQFEIVPGIGAMTASMAALKRTSSSGGARYIMQTAPFSFFGKKDHDNLSRDLSRSI